jgi:hypothetical protein
MRAMRFLVHTPVRDNRLELLELRRALRKRRELQALELRRHRVAHGCSGVAAMLACVVEGNVVCAWELQADGAEHAVIWAPLQPHIELWPGPAAEAY